MQRSPETKKLGSCCASLIVLASDEPKVVKCPFFPGMAETNIIVREEKKTLGKNEIDWSDTDGKVER